MEPSLFVVEEPRGEDRAAILELLVDFNRRNAPPAVALPLAVLLRDRDHNPVGGIWGATLYDWLCIELLFVPESARGRALGTALIRQAEAIAVGRGCVGAWLDTFSFQARGFTRSSDMIYSVRLRGIPSGARASF